jgi:hypothetical protein
MGNISNLKVQDKGPTKDKEAQKEKQSTDNLQESSDKSAKTLPQPSGKQGAEPIPNRPPLKDSIRKDKGGNPTKTNVSSEGKQHERLDAPREKSKKEQGIQSSPNRPPLKDSIRKDKDGNPTKTNVSSEGKQHERLDAPREKRTNENQARLKAREMAKLINSGNLKSKDYKQLLHSLEFFEGDAYRAFTNELDLKLSQKIGSTAKMQTGFPKGKITKLMPEALRDLNKLNNPAQDLAQFPTTEIIPTSEARVVRGGFKRSITVGGSVETDHSKTVQVYTDSSDSFGADLKIPDNKVFNLNFGGEIKEGVKETDQKEQRISSQNAVTTSRSFTIQRVERDVMRFDYLESHHISGSPSNTYVTKDDPVGNPFLVNAYGPPRRGRDIQRGYRVVPDDGGKSLTFWNDYSTYAPNDKAALDQVRKFLKSEQKKLEEKSDV